ncbi:MAG: pyridoxamine 5'-phosphate oxidase family protein [Acetatifactor sp.]|nr:pyridoxamine 5'-phosphate oxidase family protein [Acetatifactor sp.]
MFREMRRKRQELSQVQCEAVLGRGTCGVLAVSGDDGYPYAVPISYVYDNGKIFFHSAKRGHKIDAVRKDNKVSFCVTDQDQIMPAEYTTYFRSVIVFGRLQILQDEAEKLAAIEKLAVKYAPEDSAQHRNKAIEQEWEAFCILEMTIEHMTGKEAIELIKAGRRSNESASNSAKSILS